MMTGTNFGKNNHELKLKTIRPKSGMFKTRLQFSKYNSLQSLQELDEHSQKQDSRKNGKFEMTQSAEAFQGIVTESIGGTNILDQLVQSEREPKTIKKASPKKKQIKIIKLKKGGEM